MVKLNQQFDNIISIFSSQYANVSKTTWNDYINEINFRSHKEHNYLLCGSIIQELKKIQYIIVIMVKIIL